MKSGTTYLQSWLDQNTQRLAEQGLLWTRSDRNFRATDDLFGLQKTRPNLGGAWSAMKEGLDSHSGDALISNELLAAVAPKKVARLITALRPAEVHVIITARDLARVVPSQWQTAMRNRSTVTWSQCIQDICTNDQREGSSFDWFWNRQDVPGTIQTWAEHVPLDRISVVTVPPSRTPPTVLGDRFCSVLSIDPTDFKETSTANPSLGAHSAELLRRVNAGITHFDWSHYQWGVKNGLGRRVLEGRANREPVISLTQSQHDAVRAAAVAMVDRLRVLEVEVVGSLDDLVPGREAYGTPADPGDASDGELLAVALDGLVGLGEILADLRIEADQLARLTARLVSREERRLAVEAGHPAPPAMSAGDAMGNKAALLERIEALLETNRAPRRRGGKRKRSAGTS